jgi:hypothetical protein
MNSPAPSRRFSTFLGAYWRKIGGGSLALSLGIHAVLVLLFGTLIFTSSVDRRVDVIPYGVNAGAKPAQNEVKELTRAKTGLRRESLVNQTRVAVPTYDPARPSIPADILEGSLTGKLDALGARLLDAGNSPSRGFKAEKDLEVLYPPPIPKMWEGRCSQIERLNKLRENGGNDQCEKAVSLSLEWLRQQQNNDGSWGKQHKSAMTGFSLLCYLGRCYTPDNPVYGDNVIRGIQWLLEVSQKNEYGIFASNPSEHAACYEHGIATYALGETYAMARLGGTAFPGMRDAFEKGVATIIQHQLPDGGWGYGGDFCYRDGGAGDLSVTGWQFQALKAAKYSGLKIPKLNASIDRAVKYLVSRQTKDGGFGNANREQGYNQWNFTGTAVLGLQTLGEGRHRTEIGKGLRFATAFFQKEPPSWDANANLYAWYYYEQAFFQSGGDSWKQWNDAALPALLRHQNRDGSWQNETPSSSIGSTSPAGADRGIYRTALCTLMLEVYYRYLKVGDREAASMFERQ